MALTAEEQHQVKVLKKDGWDDETIVFCMVLAQLVKLPIPGIALLWANASGDFYELFPVEDDDEVDSRGT